MKQTKFTFFTAFYFLLFLGWILVLGYIFGREFIVLVKLVHLKFSNEIINGKVLDIYEGGSRMKKYIAVKYTYEYNNQKQTGKSALSLNPIPSFNFFKINKYLYHYPYKINSNIKLLVNNYYNFPENKINYEILYTLITVLLISATIVFCLIRFVHNIIVKMNLLSFIGCKKIDIYDKSIKIIERLLKSNLKNREFIIFSGKTKYEYVQYTLEEYGFLLYWPILENNDNKNYKEAEAVTLKLIEKGFKKLNLSNITRNDVENLKLREFAMDVGGIYANVGNDPNEIYKITEDLFINIYKYNDIKNIKIIL
jgi:hypothetical protein